MHLDGYMVLGSAVVGLLVGVTGAGGGALMTPMLILLFSVTPSKAISSDLVAAVFMKPLAAGVHWTKKTINWKLVGLMACASVPTAFIGPWVLKNVIGSQESGIKEIELILGIALLLGAAAMVVRYLVDKRSGVPKTGDITTLVLKPIPTILIGLAGGLIVGMTSVGSGSLMIVLLLFLYPVIGAKNLVGTDLAQAVPLTMAAALGVLVFGHLDFGITASIIVGGTPAAVAGAYFSSRAPEQYIRPVIAYVILLSGLKYIGLGNVALAWAAGSALVVGVVGWLVVTKVWLKSPVTPAPELVAADA